MPINARCSVLFHDSYIHCIGVIYIAVKNNIHSLLVTSQWCVYFLQHIDVTFSSFLSLFTIFVCTFDLCMCYVCSLVTNLPHCWLCGTTYRMFGRICTALAKCSHHDWQSHALSPSLWLLWSLTMYTMFVCVLFMQSMWFVCSIPVTRWRVFPQGTVHSHRSTSSCVDNCEVSRPHTQPVRITLQLPQVCFVPLTLFEIVICAPLISWDTSQCVVTVCRQYLRPYTQSQCLSTMCIINTHCCIIPVSQYVCIVSVGIVHSVMCCEFWPSVCCWCVMEWRQPMMLLWHKWSIVILTTKLCLSCFSFVCLLSITNTDLQPVVVTFFCLCGWSNFWSTSTFFENLTICGQIRS
jgi:hypothetical protein